MTRKPQPWSTFSGIAGYWCDKPEVLRLREILAINSKTLNKAIRQSSMKYMIWIIESDYQLLYK